MQVRQQYGVKKDLLGLLEGRETYVIGKDGTVKLVRAPPQGRTYKSRQGSAQHAQLLRHGQHCCRDTRGLCQDRTALRSRIALCTYIHANYL